MRSGSSVVAGHASSTEVLRSCFGGLIWMTLMVPALVEADTFTVRFADDAGEFSLRWAVEQANLTPGPDVIEFDIAGVDDDVHTITLKSTLTVTDTVTIDGYSQGNARENSLAEGSDASLRIVLRVENGRSLLALQGTGSLVKGLSFVGESLNYLTLAGGGSHAVQGNWFGTHADGSFRGAASVGVRVEAPDCVIGGAWLEARNVFTSNSSGITVSGHTDGLKVFNNVIGPTSSGGPSEAPGTSGVKVVFQQTLQSVQIGGLGALERNVIAHNQGSGVIVSSSTGTTIRGNSIHSNGRLGIDLAANFFEDGVTKNDPSPDADDGANGLQNFPTIDVLDVAGVPTVVGSLESTPSSPFTIDIYGVGVPDASGHGEGDQHLLAFDVTTDDQGLSQFDIPIDPEGFARFSCTATDSEGNTSEFCGIAELRGEEFTVTNLEESGPGSLCELLSQAAANGESAIDSIFFAVPGPGLVPISPCFILPPNVTIDGSTMPGYQPAGPGSPCARTYSYPVTLDAVPTGVWLDAGAALKGVNVEGRPVGIGAGILLEQVQLLDGLLLDEDDAAIRDADVTSGATVTVDSIGDSTHIENSCVEGSVLLSDFSGVVADAARITFSEIQGWIGIQGGVGNVFSHTTAVSPSAILPIDWLADGVLNPDAPTPPPVQVTVITPSTSAHSGPAPITSFGCTHQGDPDTAYRIEFFAGQSCSSHGHGPMERFLGSIDVLTDSAGTADCSAEIVTDVVPGEIVVATATGPGGTSEPTACAVVSEGQPSEVFADGFETGDTSLWQ